MKWVLAIQDKISAPAKAIAKNLGNVNGALKRADNAIAKIGGGKFAKAGDALVKGAGHGFKVAGLAAATFAATAVASLGAAGAALAAYGVQHAIEAERSQNALRTVIGDAKKADQALAGVKGLSNFLGKDPREIERQLTQLVSKGHDLADSFRIIQGAADLSAMGSDGQKLVDAFSEIDAKGKLSAEAIAAIAKSGVSLPKLREVLGTAIGSSGDLAKDIEAAFAAGTIDAAALQGAALLAITKTTGKGLGGAAKDATKTIAGQFDVLKTLPTRIFDAADTSGALAPLTKALTSLTNAMSPDTASGQKLVTAIGKISASLGKVIDTITGDGSEVGDWVDSIATGIEIAGDIIEGVSEIVSGFVDEFKTGLTAILGPMGKFGGDGMSMQKLVKGLAAAFKFFGAAVGISVGLVIQATSWLIEGIVAIAKGVDSFAKGWSKFWNVTLPNAVLDAVSWVTFHFYNLIDSLGELWQDFKDFGKAIVTGILTGIQSAWGTLKDGWNKLIATLPATVSDKLKIQSPSKIMASLGSYAAQGFTLGVRSENDNAQAAFSDLVAPPKASSAASSASMGFSVGNISIPITIHATGGDAQQIAESVEQQVEAVLHRVLRAAQVEAGAAA